MLSIEKCAEISKLSKSRLRWYADHGRLKATKISHVWLVTPEDLGIFLAQPRIRGWPRGRSRLPVDDDGNQLPPTRKRKKAQ